MNMKNHNIKLSFSAMVIAIYVVIMYITQAFASGLFQVRIATTLYALPAIFPFLVIPLALANSLSNMLVGGISFSIADIVGGFIVGLLTTSTVYFIKKMNLNDWFIALPIIFIPGLIVPIWLTPILVSFEEKVTYFTVAGFLTAGQIIPGILGVLIIKQLKNRKISFDNLLKKNR